MDYLTAAMLLFMIGAILLIAEVMLPTGGFLVVAALVCFALGVSVIFVGGTATEGLVALLGLALGLPVIGLVAVSAWKRLSLGSMIQDELYSSSVAPGANDYESLKNHVGKTVSPMRPSGSVEIDGRRIDAMTEGGMLEAGVWVRCVAIKNGKVIVRQIESPAGIVDIESGESSEALLSSALSDPPIPPQPQAKKPVDDFDDFDLGPDR